MKTKNGRMIRFSKCLVCNSNKSNFLKEQEARWVLSNQGIKTALIQIPLLYYFISSYKMNDIINTFLFTGDTFMPEIHLR